MSPFLEAEPTEHESSDMSVLSKWTASSSPSVSGKSEIDEIVVVGMACRVAGGNDTPEKFWESIMNKTVSSGEIPAMRWEPYYRRDSRNAKILDDTTSKGYFLKNLEDFDSTFFGISPKEALLMDPQQRISLEVTWEALEDAGIPPQSLAGTNAAVYMGVNSDDYSKLLLEDLPGVEAWMGIGTAYCGVPNRISYLLDLRGPSTAVDAACASSLVAIHHGRQSLLTKETDVAIVGGVNALCGPGLTRVLDKAGAISKDGTCRSFDNDANGYGRGEGASVIILKRMSDALRNHDRILAVVKGSAVGQDGRTNGIMAPNGLAQEAVARSALVNVDPKTIQYVEAHATSTSVGDPVEITAMSHIYGANREGNAPCYIGSVKPNVGHLEAGAGAVGFMKAVLALNKGVIPPQANLQKLNEKIDWATSGIRVPFEATSWPEVSQPRRAAICSYGYGGSVSHAVIEAYQAGARDVEEADIDDDGPKILLISAPQEKRLSGYAKALGEWMASSQGTKFSVSSIASTLAVRRGHHDCRAGFLVSSHEETLDLAGRLEKGLTSPDIATGRVLGKDENNGAVWLFSGHGAQWLEMGVELLAKESLFRETIQDLESVIQDEAGFSAIHALQTSDFETSDKIQVLTYVMQIGLATLLRSKGARPSAVIGHSVGEIAASVITGALTPYEGALVVCRRSVLYREVMGKGAMVLVNIPFAEMLTTLEARSDITASINSSPSSCVVSGSIEAINRWSAIWEERGIKIFKVKSDVPFHSPLLNCLATSLYTSLVTALAPRTPFIPLYSTATENPREPVPRDASYWVRNMVRPVLLTSAVEAAAKDGYRVYLEVSTHPVITHSVNETLMDMDIEDAVVIPTLLRNKPTRKALLKSLMMMWLKGVTINWKLHFGGVAWAHEVPKTEWKHQSFWKPIGTGSTDTSTMVHEVTSHTLLGQRTSVAGEKITVFTSKLDNDTKPFPGNHPLHGTEIIPAAVLFNTFLHATGTKSLTNVNLRVPVAISAPRDIQVLVQGTEVRLMSRLVQEGEEKEGDRLASWVTHTTASTVAEPASDIPAYGADINIPSIRARIGTELKTSFSIDYLSGVGVPAMGFPWAVTRHVGNTKEMLVLVDVSPETANDATLPWSATSWAPIFDAATSIGSTLFYETPRLRMPAQVGSTSVRDGAVPPKKAYIYVQEASSTSTLAVDVTITNEAGMALAKFTSMRFSEIEGTPGARKDNIDGLVHQLAWPVARLSEVPSLLKHVVLVGDEDHAFMEPYLRQLSKRRVKTTCVGSAQSLSVESNSEGTVILYLPSRVASIDDVPEAANRFCKDLLDIVKYAAANETNTRVFAVTDEALHGTSCSSLAHAPLLGLSRIIAAEQPSLWGALIDVDCETFPFHVVKNMSGADVVKVEDSIPRVGRLRAMPQNKSYPSNQSAKLQPRPDGTYIISGGLGALGLEVASFLVERGARRIVLLSRRALPPRKDWNVAIEPEKGIIGNIQALEMVGATVYCLALDLSAANASVILSEKLDLLSLPPVVGVVHAAGVVGDELVLSTTPTAFNRVLAPKVAGAITLHKAFPPTSVDFFMLFSSCGQLFGFPGQASYASGNAFLDGLAEHRRARGDNAIALQWTSWRGLGMAATTQASADFIEAELEGKGITSISRDEAFLAWDHVAKFDIAHAVILRTRTLDATEVLPADILTEIAVRRAPSTPSPVESVPAPAPALPPPGPDRTVYLTAQIAGCVATVLQLPDVSDVDPRVALPELGMDSVMTVALRKQLQMTLGVRVPPTLVWGHPTVGHLVRWFAGKV
ncbi:Malonyl transacylase ACP-bd [Glarea lozoyensis ATCC 20868]|uniref:6-methylsalicylic acid synthase n=2 Tax=Glarea lozoyensis TaxID=101852 RepID=S3D4V2_GLAL2|nr:Malonyl transacylase ACP-bd [Glarea lozoyensis ATCC 20868]AAX35547.1 polyketide syntase 2 [Glarea lozoyensis]EPE32134.1 Malonyl transacylase ACP-bd [Glarea lozoyensis ATCC 20868]